MKMRDFFGFGAKRIFDSNYRTTAIVTNVTRCRWFQVNTKPVRRYSGDGSLYPHIITFRYRVLGSEYEGKRWITWRKQPPEKGFEIQLYVDPENRERYAYETDVLSSALPERGRLC